MIPANTTCEEAYWCDSTQICARVCRPGTVRVDPWLRETLDAEWRLAAGDSFCNAQLLGTHNSAITATSGFGVRDAYFEASLRGAHLIGQHAVLATNNQYFSITDQLELGARKIEVTAQRRSGQPALPGHACSRLMASLGAGRCPLLWGRAARGALRQPALGPRRRRLPFLQLAAEPLWWCAPVGQRGDWLQPVHVQHAVGRCAVLRVRGSGDPAGERMAPVGPHGHLF